MVCLDSDRVIRTENEAVNGIVDEYMQMKGVESGLNSALV